VILLTKQVHLVDHVYTVTLDMNRPEMCVDLWPKTMTVFRYEPDDLTA
jgi:hypothetical protein